MTEGIKLYKHFTDQISKIGKPRRAWFTTFNLDIHFFEKYILSALLGYSFKELKSPYDYEALNDHLANDQDTGEDDKVEVKVFYDYRALILGNKPKQTSVQLHPIEIKEVDGLNPDFKFREGVFHPKVVLIETVAGEYWLMVSSANLTFGGWAKNREGFFCEKIEDTRIGRDVGLFFQQITNSIRGFGEAPMLTKLAYGKLGQKDVSWRFFSSFNNGHFLDQLNSSNEASFLKVWSPYYADDLDEVLRELIEDEYFDIIEIIPAKTEKQKIRITEETYNACLNQGGVSFRQDRLPFQAQASFVHAKVWLTPNSLAVGSWNMTRSGMNISQKANNNIEAGIIYSLTRREYEQVLDLYATSPLKSFAHYGQDELEKEKEEVLDQYTISIDLVADWDSLEIKLVSPTYKKLIKQIDENCVIRLPGLGTRKISTLEFALSFRGQQIELLTDRMFEVQDVSSKALFKGYMREIGLANRPINSFGSIDDYLKGWVLERPENKQELHRLAYKIDEEFGDELSEQTRKILLSDNQNSWFTSFHAFECIIKRINQTLTAYKYKSERIDELKRIGRVLPGSLSELRKHLCELKECFENDRGSFLKSPIYLWFLIEKANHVFRVFNQRVEIKDEFIQPIKNIGLEQLVNHSEIEKIGRDNLIKWMGFIKTKLREYADHT